MKSRIPELAQEVADSADQRLEPFGLKFEGMTHEELVCCVKYFFTKWQQSLKSSNEMLSAVGLDLIATKSAESMYRKLAAASRPGAKEAMTSG